MSEIVPPKLNRDTGVFSLLTNRRNVLLVIAGLLTFCIWATPVINTVDYKIITTIVTVSILVPFLLDIHGRPLHRYLWDIATYYFGAKEQRIFLGRDIVEGVIVLPNNQYAQVYRIEPINLSMSSSEEITTFKQYVQRALFALKSPIQILSIQTVSQDNDHLATEMQRYEQLSGKLQQQCQQYIVEYQQLNSTMQRSFYLVMTTHAGNLKKAQQQLQEEENSFGRLLEQTKISLTKVPTYQIIELAHHIIPQKS